MPLHQDLPPLMALRAFEAVARHLSFIKAADELSVTQSAISHQVHKLEEFLDQPLFVRRTRAIDLTPAGEQYYRQIEPALAAIAAATHDLRGERPTTLRIGLLASFATLWLAPRLADFNTKYPNIHVELLPAVQLADVDGGEVDLAIRYGKGGWPKVQARRFMTETLTPVCSPAFKARGMQNGPLLMAKSHQPFEWIDWQQHSGIDLAQVPSVMLHDYNIVVEAAVAGQGIAMGRQCLIDRRFKEGALVPAFDTPPMSGEIGYWLVTPERPPNPAAQAFSQWLEQIVDA
ncbi:LysR family transcriptional regulator [Pseudomonas sp. FW215-R2]|uniref:LysR substrate-binding domain-containing protein n=1 Tax=unclassified Pseudomonas TaxID=196821 RepID=UPI000C87E53C|nr:MULTISPECIES: LysR substrate-binding domain-containing protein [unclassified Pseudomonas]PMX01464.1 LysR family transcriptional regulator [Pseudomonas sp. FW215-R2]PMX07837.1 LysR family transcriptional regulator [Pseudomonas sp. FW215-L1]PMX21756.1 LysR family transcriptional regulator [Pseudomonas sp. FW215-E1]PNA26711.1 LysR family transcriptional regulator [Pseudomonas sp. FW215-R4]